MKFAHLSDCHIGGWHESNLRNANMKSFQLAIETCIKEHVGFVLISGDLFDTALPSIDTLKETARILNMLNDYDISVYVIPGSHDFSASGKTMLDVLENAGLVHNVMKFTSENELCFTLDRTGVKITGFYGRKGGLEASEYDCLKKFHLESESGFKIFMFHTLIDEMKPKNFELVKGASVNILPKNFNYYAGGHPHFVHNAYFDNYGIIAYPGPLFPNNFKELEELKCGGFYIVDNIDSKLDIRHIKINPVDVQSYFINAENKTAKEVEDEIINIVTDFKDKIVTLRIEGCLKSGKTTDINFKYISEKLASSYCFLKNTVKLTSAEFDAIKIDFESPINIEEKIINEYSTNSDFKSGLIKDLMHALDKEKIDGEKSSDYELRVLRDCANFLEH